MAGRPKTYPFYALIAAPDISTDLLWDLTMLFVLLCAVYFAVIFFFRRKLTLGSKSNRKRKKELSPMISEFLFYDEKATKEEKTNYVNLKIEIRDLLTDDFNRKILIDILMDLRKDLSGATLDKLFELYQSLGLHHDSYKKLESWRWQTISTGILELTQMQVEESYGFVKKFINNKKSTIRKQSEIAIITLNDEGLCYFLDTTNYRISEWQQLKILEVLKNKSDFQPPSFKHWLISKNKDVVLFALRLMSHYNQSDGNQALIELLKHKKSEIKAAAINCIKEFHVVEAVETLKLVFWNSTVDIKINILGALASLGTANDIGFLKSISGKESNFNVKSKASATINAIAPLSVMPTMDIQSVEKFEVPADIPIGPVEENDEENLGNDAGKNSLKAFEITPNEADFNSIELGTNDQIEVDAEEEQKHELKENYKVEEVLQKPLEAIDANISTSLENDNAKESENEVVQEPSINQNSEPIIENNKEIDITNESTFKIDFLPFVTEKGGTIIPYRYNKNQNSGVENKKVQEEVPVKHEMKFSMEASKINFLPIVVEEIKTVLPYKFDAKQVEKDVGAELFNIETNIEVVGQKNMPSIENEQLKVKKPIKEEDVDISVASPMLDFLPIVVASEKEIDQNESVGDSKPIDVCKIPVIYTEVKFEITEVKLNKILSELNELVPLPADPLPENKTKQKTKSQASKVPTSINTIDMKKIRRIECKGVEIKSENQEKVQEAKQKKESNVYNELDEVNTPVNQSTLDWILAENEAKGELKQKIKTIVDQQKFSSIKLPKPIFYSKREANTVALLDDIEALGDKREVSLLQDLLLDQDISTLHERIRSLIERISDTSVLKKEPRIDDDKDNFSVFEEFFRTADSESRLILLDEIVELGDVKDLSFLKRFIENSSGKVKKKAKQCLDELTAKLVQNVNVQKSDSSNTAELVSQNETMVEENNPDQVPKSNEISKEKPFNVFEIDFEIDFDKEHENQSK